MGLQEAKEPRPLGELRKQGPIVARQPAIKGAVAPAFEGVEQPQGDHLTGPEASLGMFGDGAQLVIDLSEQGGDKVHGGHTALLSWERMSHRPAWRSRLTPASPKMCTVSFDSSILIE